MTQDEIIRMAREVDAITGLIGRWIFLDAAHLERFAALVAAHEREKQVEQEPVCNRCNGTKVVSDGLIDNIGGAPLEVPIGCVKDCPDCVAPVQPVKQKPVAEVVTRFHNVGFGRKEERKDIQFLAEVEVGTKLYAAPQTVSQEPVAYYVTAGRRVSDGMQVVFGDDEILYAAPVRTKDLTDDEIMDLARSEGAMEFDCEKTDFARAVIAADRRNNK